MWVWETKFSFSFDAHLRDYFINNPDLSEAKVKYRDLFPAHNNNTVQLLTTLSLKFLSTTKHSAYSCNNCNIILHSHFVLLYHIPTYLITLSINANNYCDYAHLSLVHSFSSFAFVVLLYLVLYCASFTLLWIIYLGYSFFSTFYAHYITFAASWILRIFWRAAVTIISQFGINQEHLCL